MDPARHVTVFEVFVDQRVGFLQAPAQRPADQQGEVGAGLVLRIFHAQLQLADGPQILLGERTVEQVQAQHAVAVGGQFVGLLAGRDQHRAFGPGQAGVFQAGFALLFVHGRQVLLCATIGFGVHERVEAGEAVADPAAGGAFRQTAEQRHVEHVGADAGDHRQCAQRDLVEFAPGLVGGVALVAAGHLERGDLEGLLLLDAHTALRQLELQRSTGVDLQAVVEQLALDPLLEFAALGQLVGTTGEEHGAAQGGAGKAMTASGHDLF
ncbi:hypothetical protein D9M71_262330 [compost metagenome]